LNGRAATGIAHLAGRCFAFAVVGAGVSAVAGLFCGIAMTLLWRGLNHLFIDSLGGFYLRIDNGNYLAVSFFGASLSGLLIFAIVGLQFGLSGLSDAAYLSIARKTFRPALFIGLLGSFAGVFNAALFFYWRQSSTNFHFALADEARIIADYCATFVFIVALFLSTRKSALDEVKRQRADS